MLAHAAVGAIVGASLVIRGSSSVVWSKHKSTFVYLDGEAMLASKAKQSLTVLHSQLQQCACLQWLVLHCLIASCIEKMSDHIFKCSAAECAQCRVHVTTTTLQYQLGHVIGLCCR